MWCLASARILSIYGPRTNRYIHPTGDRLGSAPSGRDRHLLHRPMGRQAAVPQRAAPHVKKGSRPGADLLRLQSALCPAAGLRGACGDRETGHPDHLADRHHRCRRSGRRSCPAGSALQFCSGGPHHSLPSVQDRRFHRCGRRDRHRRGDRDPRHRDEDAGQQEDHCAEFRHHVREHHQFDRQRHPSMRHDLRGELFG